MAEEKFTKEEVLRVVELAHLSLTEEEINTTGDELSAILAFISKLQEIDVKNMKPTSHGGDTDNSLREDDRENVAKDESTRAKNIRDAFPNSENDMLKVPKILNQDES